MPTSWLPWLPWLRSER